MKKLLVFTIIYLMFAYVINDTFAAEIPKSVIEEPAKFYTTSFYNINYDIIAKKYVLEVKHKNKIYNVYIEEMCYNKYLVEVLKVIYSNYNYRILTYKNDVLRIEVLKKGGNKIGKN